MSITLSTGLDTSSTPDYRIGSECAKKPSLGTRILGSVSLVSGTEIRVNAGRGACGSVFVIVFCLCLLFALYTQHVWEDFYIAFRVSKNLADGNGLVYVPGERVQAFTSPLGVLIPALLCMSTGNSSDYAVLWLFRGLSSAALASAAILLLRIATKLQVRLLPGVLLIGMFALDTKIVDFTINGMETGILTFFLVLTLHSLLIPAKPAALRLGFAWAGLMWTRPDSFIFIGSLCVGFLIFEPRISSLRGRVSLMQYFLKSGLFASLLYLPWLAWAWHYYGSPIPHSIIAKGLNRNFSPLGLVGGLAIYPLASLLNPQSLAVAFLPPYPKGPLLLNLWSVALAWPCAMAWISSRMPGVFRAISFGLILGCFYLDAITPLIYPWYIVPCTLLSIFVMTGTINQILESFRKSSHPLDPEGRCIAARLSLGFLTTALILSASLTVWSAHRFRIQQQLIEEGNRKQIGLWLSRQAASQLETVFLEPLGYIGFYSQLRMLDYPGIGSPDIVRVRRKLRSDRGRDLIRELKPDWVVLRQEEVETIRASDPDLLTISYQMVRIFDVSRQIEPYSWWAIGQYLIRDATYAVYRRRQ